MQECGGGRGVGAAVCAAAVRRDASARSQTAKRIRKGLIWRSDEDLLIFARFSPFLILALPLLFCTRRHPIIRPSPSRHSPAKKGSNLQFFAHVLEEIRLTGFFDVRLYHTPSLPFPSLPFLLLSEMSEDEEGGEGLFLKDLFLPTFFYSALRGIWEITALLSSSSSSCHPSAAPPIAHRLIFRSHAHIANEKEGFLIRLSFFVISASCSQSKPRFPSHLKSCESFFLV